MQSGIYPSWNSITSGRGRATVARHIDQSEDVSCSRKFMYISVSCIGDSSRELILTFSSFDTWMKIIIIDQLSDWFVWSIGLCYANRPRDPSCVFKEQLLINVESVMRQEKSTGHVQRDLLAEQTQQNQKAKRSFRHQCRSISLIKCWYLSFAVLSPSMIISGQSMLKISLLCFSEQTTVHRPQTKTCTQTHTEEIYRIYAENTRYIIW